MKCHDLLDVDLEAKIHDAVRGLESVGKSGIYSERNKTQSKDKGFGYFLRAAQLIDSLQAIQ